MLQPGHIINDTYRVESLLGSGGMADVYVVAHMRMPRKFALKVMRLDVSTRQAFLDRFNQEGEILATVRHPHIVDVIDRNQLPDGSPYLVMELLDGEDLYTEYNIYGSVIASQHDIIGADGMNEVGLAGHLLWLAESDYGTYDPEKTALGMSVWLQYMLDNFATVAECVAWMEEVDLQVVSMVDPIYGRNVTLHLVRVADPRAFGCVPTDADGRVTAFLEKTQDPPTDQINAGCYVFDRAIIDRIPRGREVSVEREVFPGLLSSGVKMCGYVDATYWRDMGTPEDFVRGSADLVRGIAPSPALGDRRGECLVHDGASVAPGALLIGGTVIGRGAEIGPGSRLDGAVIFDGAKVEAGSVIERSIIGAGARIGPRALIRDGVIGDGADIGARCELLRGARVWPGVVLPDCGIRYSSDV